MAAPRHAAPPAARPPAPQRPHGPCCCGRGGPACKGREMGLPPAKRCAEGVVQERALIHPYPALYITLDAMRSVLTDPHV